MIMRIHSGVVSEQFFLMMMISLIITIRAKLWAVSGLFQCNFKPIPKELESNSRANLISYSRGIITRAQFQSNFRAIRKSCTLRHD